MNSRDYWAERARQDKIKVIKTGEQGIDNLKRILKTNLDDVEKKIKEFYDKYGDNPAEKLSYDEFEKYKRKLAKKAKKYPQDKTLQKLAKQDIPKYKIDRLRALQIDLQMQLTEATAGQEAGIYKTLNDVGKVSQAVLAKRFKDTIGLEFNTIASRKMKQLMTADWCQGKNWSDRIWADRDKVGEKLTEILEKGVTQGTSLQKMSRELRDVTGNSFNNAFRLIRTETSHIDGQVTLEGYKQAKDELGLEYYEYDAFLDSRTSNICRELDKKRFRIDEAEVGVNYPPMHPNCRSTTQMVLDEDYKQKDKPQENIKIEKPTEDEKPVLIQKGTQKKGSAIPKIHEDKLTDNPKINGKIIKGSYNKSEVEELQKISDSYIKAGYTPSGHVIQRTFERKIKPERALDVIKTGKKYSDTKNSVAYYKNRVSVHISKETGQIKTIIFYDKNDTPPLKRNRNAKRKK